MHHLRSHHNASIDVSTLKFQNFESFIEWKEQEEMTSHSSYTQACAPQTYGDNQHWYYYCNRSGKYQPKGHGQRQIKSQGTCKTGEQCIAHIKATVDALSGQVVVKYCATHHNHDIRLAHLRMSNETRMNVTAKLQQGVSIERILDDIRDCH